MFGDNNQAAAQSAPGIKCFSLRLQQILHKNAQIAISFLPAFQKEWNKKKVQSGFSVLFSIRKDFLSTALRISHFLVDLSLLSLFAFVVSGSGAELRK